MTTAAEDSVNFTRHRQPCTRRPAAIMDLQPFITREYLKAQHHSIPLILFW